MVNITNKNHSENLDSLQYEPFKSPRWTERKHNHPITLIARIKFIIFQKRTYYTFDAYLWMIGNDSKISENSNRFAFRTCFLSKRNGIFRSFDYWNFVRSHSVLGTLTTFAFNFCHNKNWIMVLSYGATSHFKRRVFFYRSFWIISSKRLGGEIKFHVFRPLFSRIDYLHVPSTRLLIWRN